MSSSVSNSFMSPIKSSSKTATHAELGSTENGAQRSSPWFSPRTPAASASTPISASRLTNGSEGRGFNKNSSTPRSFSSTSFSKDLSSSLEALCVDENRNRRGSPSSPAYMTRPHQKRSREVPDSAQSRNKSKTSRSNEIVPLISSNLESCFKTLDDIEVCGRISDDELIATTISFLGEPSHKKEYFQSAITTVGASEFLLLLRKTAQREADGGMLRDDGSKRTVGGVFFKLLEESVSKTTWKNLNADRSKKHQQNRNEKRRLVKTVKQLEFE